MHPKIYRDYFRLGETSYREKMKFFETYHQQIDAMHFDDAIDLRLDYLCCLFEVGRYERYLQFVDEVLEIVISENILTYKGEDIFVELLFKKAACLYHTKAYEPAMKILVQLRTMAPKHEDVSKLYSLCKRQLPHDITTTVRAIGMASLLMITGICVARILVVSPFFAEAIAYFSSLQWLLVCVSISAFVAAELIFQSKVYKELGMFPSEILNKVVGLFRRSGS